MELKGKAELCVNDDLQAIVQEIKFWPFNQMVYAQTLMRPR